MSDAPPVARRCAPAVIRLPGHGNLSRGDLADLAQALEAAGADPAVGAVLLHGATSEFCNGLNLAEFADEPGLDQLAAALGRCFKAFALLPKPLVISVDGFACGFGATMLCHADVVIASPRTRIRMPFVDLGLVPEAGSTLLLARQVGHLNAVRLLCLGEEIDAVEARRMGLVTTVVAETMVEQRAMDFARDFARRPVDLVGMTRLLMRPDREAVTERIEVEIKACLERLRLPTVRRRLARFAGASLTRSETRPAA